MNRRGHGEGTIYQRKDGRYEASLRLGEGKRRSFYGKTRKEVRDKLNEALRAHESGRPSALISTNGLRIASSRLCDLRHTLPTPETCDSSRPIWEAGD
jgi:hypothetical protein